MRTILEICCGSFEDVKAACEHGADRVELNSALYLGGLTPSLASLIHAKEECAIPIVAMVRPRGGGFCYSEDEYKVMYSDAKQLLEHGADGIAFGFLKEDKTIDLERTREMADLISGFGKEAVFHRAFDCVSNQKEAVRQLISLNIDRILTSGGAADAWSGREQIKMLQKEYGEQIAFLPGSGVNEKNAKELIRFTGVHQVHSSCKVWSEDKTCSNETVDFSYAGETLKNKYESVSGEKVAQLVKSLK